MVAMAHPTQKEPQKMNHAITAEEACNYSLSTPLCSTAPPLAQAGLGLKLTQH
jgi:hypothetical protein